MIDVLLQINHVLGILGILCLFVIGGIIIDFLMNRRLAKYIYQWGMWVALFATISSVILTLIYSEKFGITPCGLCWFERIALYPQVIILATAIYYKDTLVSRYGIILSSFGLVVSLYHHYIQMGGSELIKCPAASGDCAKRFLFEFNFITFPLLSAILFVFLISLYIYMLKIRST